MTQSRLHVTPQARLSHESAGGGLALTRILP